MRLSVKVIVYIYICSNCLKLEYRRIVKCNFLESVSEFCNIEGVFTYTGDIPHFNYTLYINGESVGAVCWSYKSIREG
jgi:hypothetical protein